jgi:hypothetical protein
MYIQWFFIVVVWSYLSHKLPHPVRSLEDSVVFPLKFLFSHLGADAANMLTVPNSTTTIFGFKYTFLIKKTSSIYGVHYSYMLT